MIDFDKAKPLELSIRRLVETRGVSIKKAFEIMYSSEGYALFVKTGNPSCLLVVGISPESLMMARSRVVGTAIKKNERNLNIFSCVMYLEAFMEINEITGEEAVKLFIDYKVFDHFNEYHDMLESEYLVAQDITHMIKRMMHDGKMESSSFGRG